MARRPLAALLFKGIKLLAAAAIIGALMPFLIKSPLQPPAVVSHQRKLDGTFDESQLKNPRAFNAEDSEKIHFVRSRSEIRPASYVAPKLPKEFWRVNNTELYFRFPINEPDLCEGKQVDFFLMMLSAPSHVKNRSKIREFWATDSEFHNIASIQLVQPVFLLGETNNSRLQSYIDAESRIHHDVIQANFTDSYSNLTYKVLSGLVWATQFCPQAKYVYKLDDDDGKYMLRSLNIRTYLHKRLTNHNLGLPRREIFCFRSNFEFPNAKRDPKNKWYASHESYPETFYPPHCYGNLGYAITMDVVKEVIDMSRRTRVFWLEDVYITGILRVMIGNITITQLPKFALTSFG